MTRLTALVASRAGTPGHDRLGRRMRQCRWHKKDFICDRCPEVTKTDAHGFPHAQHERGPNHPPHGGQKAAHLLRKRLRICSGCESPKSWNEWDRARGQCLACSGALSGVEL
jgi:hypothetical protein